MLKLFYILLLGTIAPLLHGESGNPFVSGFNFMKQFTYKEKTVMVARNGNIYFGRKKLNQYDNGNGYKTVSIKSKLFYVQIIVCTVYHGIPPTKEMQANHINGIRWDNRAVNLRWDTPSDNHKHAWRELGRVHSRNQSLRKGANHQYSKPVDQLDIVTKAVIQTFPSIKNAADSFMVDPSAIYNVIVKRNRAKSCKGFDWQYNPKGNQYKAKFIYFIEDGKRKRKLNT